jgi:hypothetical protein
LPTKANANHKPQSEVDASFGSIMERSFGAEVALV